MFKFEINQKVTIIDMECAGRIEEISITEKGTKFLVRFINNGDLQKWFLYEDEIEASY
tara:strand:+ start:353 stop:526 length:174 start_codon:yes stop_codon:yes gene_type:complete